jgi:uncharacterized protein DUF3105
MRRLATTTLFLVLFGCGDASTSPPADGGGSDGSPAAGADGDVNGTSVLDGPSADAGGDAPPPAVDRGASDAGVFSLAGGSCDVEVAMPPDEGANHVPDCSPVNYRSKPPSSGSHYGSWPVFRVYDKPVPWGYLMHGLEHGAVVIVYHCADGCPDQVAAMKALLAATPNKPGCTRPPVIVAPDPTLDVPFAATAWGYTLRARCFDRDRFAGFIEQRASQGPEHLSGDCGYLDREATGWCPQ